MCGMLARARETPPPRGHRIRFVPMLAGVLLAVFAAYANHFHNSFHFDDHSAISENPYIRSLSHLPQIFTDARTSTVNPHNQIYRPLVTASLAIDHWLAGGLDTFWYHVSTFVWYLLQLALMGLLFTRIFDLARPGPRNASLALFAVAWYGLHPASAETINYIWQRGDLYATLGVVAGLLVYLRWPRHRRFGLYLAPALVGMLAKQSALMFAPLLFVYVLLFETDWGLEGSTEGWRHLRRAVLASLPAFALCLAYYLFQRALSASWDPGGVSAVQYWMTQPIVLLHYVKSFFLPTELSADTDRELVTSLVSETSVIGLAFLFLFALGAWRACRARELRPVAFGMGWFIVASVPTCVVPLAEVENDHRMFFPFVGLVPAVCWAGAVYLERRWGHRAGRTWRQFALVGGALCLLGAYGYGAHVRNSVWRTDEGLWQDVVRKSPRNGRGLMNYGLALMARGDYAGALKHFEDARFYRPNYSTLFINLGIASGEVGDDPGAEKHFRRALELAPGDAEPYYFYARWLRNKGKAAQAQAQLRKAVELNSALLAARYLLMELYSEQHDAAALRSIAEQTLARFPSDPTSARHLAMIDDPGGAAIQDLERAMAQKPTPEGLVDLSLLYEQRSRHQECIATARRALTLRPDYAEAYNNIAAANAAMARWDEAITAAERAIRLKPDFQVARNNLAHAISQKALQGAPGTKAAHAPGTP